MASNSNEQTAGSPRWPYLLLAALIFAATFAVLAGLWQLPNSFPQLAGPLPTSIPSTSTPGPSPAPILTPAVRQPTISEMTTDVDDGARTITFYMKAEVPPDRQVEDVILWYDTETGHQLQRSEKLLSNRVTLSYTLDAIHEGLTMPPVAGQAEQGALGYWWLVRDTAGETTRAGGSVALGPALQAMVVTPTLSPVYADFTWAVSESLHIRFHYVPGGAAERDRFQIGTLAETAFERTAAILELDFDGQMDVYLVPRVFWQGGAAYSGKVHLISYLDRNYTAVETWSYFTHEGTHALAQDLMQPREGNEAFDGVLVEGLAVWATGGHYREEPIDDWAAILAGSDQYIPLADLRAGPFYDYQHEISYLEGASFVKFLIERSGLATFKELYGLATDDATYNESLVQRLYGSDYDRLEGEWLASLAELEPTPEQVETLHLGVRSFDLVRRYEAELDPDARILPPNPPPEWTTDTLKAFLHRSQVPMNVVLETALIAAQDRLHSGDLAGAAALLDDVEAALDAGGDLDQTSLRARLAILELLGAQDRAVLHADAAAYRETLDLGSTLSTPSEVQAALQPPYVSYRQEVVRLDLTGAGLHAYGVVLVHAAVPGGASASDGQLFAVTFTHVAGQWLMTSREPLELVLAMPPIKKE